MCWGGRVKASYQPSCAHVYTRVMRCRRVNVVQHFYAAERTQFWKVPIVVKQTCKRMQHLR